MISLQVINPTQKKLNKILNKIINFTKMKIFQKMKISNNPKYLLTIYQK
jgi:hypothetical protein